MLIKILNLYKTLLLKTQHKRRRKKIMVSSAVQELQIAVLLGTLCFVGLISWLTVLQVNTSNNTGSTTGNTVLAPQITNMTFDSSHNVKIGLSGSIVNYNGGVVYQYVSIMRALQVFLPDEIPDPTLLPTFSASRTFVTFSNLTLLGGDVIIHRFYSTNNVMTGSVLASVTKTYHRLCIVEMRNISIPYCWNMTAQNYCPVPPQIGITGQILTNASAYVAANVSSSLSLDQRSGCFFVLLNSALDRTLFRSMHGDIRTTQSGQGNCMKFSYDIVGSHGTFVLPSFKCTNRDCMINAIVVGDATVFIHFDSETIDREVIITEDSNIPPYIAYLTIPTDNITITNATICGYMESWSFKTVNNGGKRKRQSFGTVLQTGIVNVFHWGDLGLTHLDFNYLAIGFSLPQQSFFTNVSATDQPSVSTLESLVGFQYIFNTGFQPSTNIISSISTWDVSRVISFDNMFYVNIFGDVDINPLSNWRLNNQTGSTFYRIFSSITANYGGVDVSQWNPLVSNMDEAFYNQGVVIPNISSWILMPQVCANNAFSVNSLLTTTLYDALLIKFANETSSVNCIWSNLESTRSNTTEVNAAVNTLCHTRGWFIGDQNGDQCV